MSEKGKDNSEDKKIIYETFTKKPPKSTKPVEEKPIFKKPKGGN